MSDSEGSDSGSGSSGSSDGEWEGHGSGIVGSPSHSPGRSPSRSPGRSASRSPGRSPSNDWGSSEGESAGSAAPPTPNLRAQGGESKTPSLDEAGVSLDNVPDWFKPVWVEMENYFIPTREIFTNGRDANEGLDMNIILTPMIKWLNDNKGTIKSWWNPEVNNDEILILLTNLLVLYHEQGVLDKTVPASKDAEAQKAYLAQKKERLHKLQADILAEMNSAGKGGASKASEHNNFVALRF